MILIGVAYAVLGGSWVASMFNRSLKLNIIAGIVSIVFIFACVNKIFWLDRVQRALESEFNLQVRTAVALSSAPIAKALWEFDFQNAAGALDGLRELPAYEFGVVESAGEIFVEGGVGDDWRDEWDAALADLATRGAEVGRHEIGDALIIVEPLTFQGGDVGVLKLGFSTRDLDAQSSAALYNSAAYGVVLASLLVLFLSLWLSRLIGPIAALAHAVRRISKGDLPDRLLADGRSDEIGDLAHAVDLLRASFVEARTDQLTGLANRRALDDRLAADGGDYALLLIDLNDFKPINDAFGHEAGDFVLSEVAQRLRRRGNGRATAFRLGGDEFALVVPHMSDAAGARALAAQAAADVHQAISFKGEQLHVGVSVGVALSSRTSGRPSDVLSAADTAMYLAKQSATHSVILYENNEKHRRYNARDRRDLEAALATGAIAPWLQPQVCLGTGQIRGFEALARWRHPHRGVLEPSAFLPIVEELQMQRAFDFAMTRHALSFIRDSFEMGAEPTKVAVNISEQTLSRPESVEQLLCLLDDFRPFLQYFTLEITEDVFVARSAEAIRRALEQLFKVGVHISMDDFGTGYGSFRHLQEWDFHELKIDRSFVQNIGLDRSSEVIIQSFISLSKGLGARTVAEGVETDFQLDFLRKNGCDLGQGYLFGKPEPIASCAARVALGRAPSIRPRHVSGAV